MYLDNAATTRVSQMAIDAMVTSMNKDFGNPSSLHSMGLQAERGIKKARVMLAEYIKAEPKQLIFTSGATESSNLVLRSVLDQARGEKKHIITTQIEHPSVLEVFKKYQEKGYPVTYLPCNEWGGIDPENLRLAMTKDTVLVSIMAINNEVGSIQPIQQLCQIVKSVKPDVFFHTDAVQALGKVPVDLMSWGVDAASFSGHKLYGPKGIGLLFVKSSTRLHPLFLGGGQEMGIRNGTENVPGIMGFVTAVEEFSRAEEMHRALFKKLKKECIHYIEENIEESMILSPLDEKHSDSIVSVAFKNIKSEVLIHELERLDVFVSSGSACSSHKKGSVSHVIQSMRVPQKYSEGVIRISFSVDQEEEKLLDALKLMKQAVLSQREITSRRHR